MKEVRYAVDGKAQHVYMDGDDLIVEGVVSDFDLDRDGEKILPGAFEGAIETFMENPIALYHHKPSMQLGVFEDVQLDGSVVRGKARLPTPPDGTEARHVWNLTKRGFLRGFSIGGAFERVLTENGPRISKIDLQEISLTPLPVNPRTLAAQAGKAVAEVEAPEPTPADTELRELVDDMEQFVTGLTRILFT